jgi:hypothetical protein
VPGSVRISVIVTTGVVVLAIAVGVWLFTRPIPALPPSTAADRPAESASRPAATPRTPPGPDATSVPARRTAPRPAAPAPVVAEPAEAAPTTATLRVEADVPDATVFLDRVGVGTAPLTIPNVAPGSHRLNVSATGYDGYSETIEVAPGPRTISVAFKEVKLDAKLDAIHKHGVGSCRGVLSATRQGLHYEAADGKDSFSVALTDFAAFDVDYLAKNLRLKTKQGRTYNFGDPEGNADRLFVFHRDVDAARKRIVTGH